MPISSLNGKYVRHKGATCKDGIKYSCDKITKAWQNHTTGLIECRVVSPVDKMRYNICLNEYVEVVNGDGTIVLL